MWDKAIGRYEKWLDGGLYSIASLGMRRAIVRRGLIHSQPADLDSSSFII
jgi:hypothetical protein